MVIPRKVHNGRESWPVNVDQLGSDAGVERPRVNPDLTRLVIFKFEE